MNEILQLKGAFEQKDSNNKPSFPNVPKKKYVTINHMVNLKKNLEEVRIFWQNEKLKIKPLVSAYYFDVVAKSNRIKGIFESGIKRNNDLIVGAKFSDGARKLYIKY